MAPDRLPFDVAERKGIGHPDSLADLVADTFSRSYAAWCIERFGVILNHWVDKVNLVGAAATVSFGAFTIDKPIDCYLFGKVTDKVGSVEVPVRDIFEASVVEVFSAALADPAVLSHLRYQVVNTRGSALDHDRRFYRPGQAVDIARVLASESVANDTVICVGNSRRGLAAEVAVRLERRVVSDGFRANFPSVGTDVKVMVVRVGDEVDVTAAVPLRPDLTPSWAAYEQALADVKESIEDGLRAILRDVADGEPVALRSLAVNTKDVLGRGYVAPFGTSLGKGDCGVVGRGNPYSGAIEPYRSAGCEAPAGKNPLHHVGKIYTVVAATAAREVEAATGAYAEVTITSRNGARLDDPAHVLVALDEAADLEGDEALIEEIVTSAVKASSTFPDAFLAEDPIVRFREDKGR